MQYMRTRKYKYANIQYIRTRRYKYANKRKKRKYSTYVDTYMRYVRTYMHGGDTHTLERDRGWLSSML